MRNENGPLNWPARKLTPYVRRDALTLDGRGVTLWAYPCGIPPRGWRVSFAPAIFVFVQDAWAFLRYRIKHHGAWVVELRDQSVDRVVADGTFPSRTAAMDGLEDARRVVPNLALGAIANETLKAPSKVE